MPVFELLRFNPRRKMRGAPAAEVRFQSEDGTYVIWMDRADIEANIKEWGNDIGLLDARMAYRIGKEIPERETR